MATVDPTAAAQAPAAAAAPALATANAGAPTIGASGPAPAGTVQAAAAGPALLAAPLVQPGAAAGGGAPVPPLAVAPAVPPPPQGGGAGGGGAGGGGGGGGGGGAGPQPAPVGPPFDSYADLFGSLPTGGTNYVAKAQALGGDPARGHVQVLTAAVAFGTAVTDFAYLGFRPTPTGPRGVILLVPDKHLDLPTQGPSGYNDAVLLQLGDVIRLGPSRQFSLATVANGIFTRRTVRAPTEAHLATVLANGHDLNTGIPPFAVGDADGEELQYRQLVPVPPGLAGLLLPRSGHLTVSDAHTYLETFETAQGEQYENIRRLVRAASVMDNNHWPVTLEATSLSEVVPTREILQNRLRILDRDLGPLPSGVLAGLPARAPPLGLDSNQVGTAIGQALRTAGGSGLLGGPTPKNLVTEMEPAALARLLRLAHVASEVELEANCNLWTRLVQCKAKSRPNVLESAMEAARTAHYPDLPRAAPIVSTSLAQAVWEVNCAYVGSDISGGWSAFRFAYGGAKHQEDARARKEAGTIVLGGATATLQDLVSIKALDDDNLAAPTTYVELKLSLVLLLCAYTAMLGAQHPLVAELRELVRVTVFYEATLAEHFETFPEQPLQLFVHISHRINTYIEDHAAVADYRTLGRPDLVGLVGDIRNRCFVAPIMPSKIQPTGTPAPPPTPPTVGSSVSTLTGSSGASTPTINISLPPEAFASGGGRQPGGAPPGGGGKSSTMVERVDAAGQPTGTDPNLSGKLGGKRMSNRYDALKEHWPKRGSDPVCLPFLVNGRCFDKCRKLHLNKDQTTAAIYAQAEKCCQKISELN